MEHSPTLTIRCECGRLRNFKVENILKAISARQISGTSFNTECEHCHRKFDVGLGMHHTMSNFTATVPKYFESEGQVVEDVGSMVEPAK